MSTTTVRHYLRPREVAEILDVKLETVLAYIRAGQLAAVNVAHPDARRRARWRISIEALEQFVTKRTIQPAPSKPAPRPRQQ